MAQLTKNQHFVPKHYLRAWQLDSGRLWVNDLVTHKVYPLSDLTNVCSEPYFYDHSLADSTLGVTQFTEHNLGRAESAIAQVHKDVHVLQVGDSLDEFARLGIAGAVILQYWRTSAMRTALNLAAVERTMAAAKREWEAWNPGMPFPAVRIRPNDSKARQLNLLHEPLQFISAVNSLKFFNLRLTLTPPGTYFLTSDNPVVALGRQSLSTSPLFPSPEGLAEIGMPLTPSVYARFVNPALRERRVPLEVSLGSEAEVAILNAHAVLCSSRKVISPKREIATVEALNSLDLLDMRGIRGGVAPDGVERLFWEWTSLFDPSHYLNALEKVSALDKEL